MRNRSTSLDLPTALSPRQITLTVCSVLPTSAAIASPVASTSVLAIADSPVATTAAAGVDAIPVIGNGRPTPHARHTKTRVGTIKGGDGHSGSRRRTDGMKLTTSFMHPYTLYPLIFLNRRASLSLVHHLSNLHPSRPLLCWLCGEVESDEAKIKKLNSGSGLRVWVEGLDLGCRAFTSSCRKVWMREEAYAVRAAGSMATEKWRRASSLGWLGRVSEERM